MIRKGVNFDEETMEKIKKAAKLLGMDASTFIRYSTLNELDSMEDKLKDGSK